MPSTGVPSEENIHKEIGKAASKRGNNSIDGLVNEEGLPDGLLGGGDQADDAFDIYYENYERSYSKRHALRKNKFLIQAKKDPILIEGDNDLFSNNIFTISLFNY